MALSPPPISPFLVDGLLTDEKIKELLALGTEYPELDYKSTLEVATQRGVVECAKDVGAMQVRGGYILAGVDDNGTLTGFLDNADLTLFDEARFAPSLRRFLPASLEVRTRELVVDGHKVLAIYVGRHPDGCAIFHTPGVYRASGGRDVTVFRAGDIYWRDGTSSTRLSQQGLQELIARNVEDAKSAWFEEQSRIRAQERADLEAAYASRSVAQGPLGAVSFELDGPELSRAVLELIRAGDEIGLQRLFKDVAPRARSAIERDEIEVELRDLVDKLTCVAATLLDYGQEVWSDAAIAALVEVFELGFGGEDGWRFGASGSLDPAEKGPRVWLLVLERAYALGALAVRCQNWAAVRALVLRDVGRIDEYYSRDWLRFALTMASRAAHLSEERDGRTVAISLLTRAVAGPADLACVNPREVHDDALLSSLAQFDLLAALIAADEAGSVTSFRHLSFSRFYAYRVEPAVVRLIEDGEMRQRILPGPDDALAVALDALGRAAVDAGFRYDGFTGWSDQRVVEFIERNLPKS